MYQQMEKDSEEELLLPEPLPSKIKANVEAALFFSPPTHILIVLTFYFWGHGNIANIKGGKKAALRA